KSSSHLFHSRFKNNNNLYFKMKLLILISGLLLLGQVVTIARAEEEHLISLGYLFECPHSLKGHVWAKNERQIVITNFHYDGRGPAAWFHAQLPPASDGIQTGTPGTFVTLPFPDSNCES